MHLYDKSKDPAWRPTSDLTVRRPDCREKAPAWRLPFTTWCRSSRAARGRASGASGSRAPPSYALGSQQPRNCSSSSWLLGGGVGGGAARWLGHAASPPSPPSQLAVGSPIDTLSANPCHLPHLHACCLVLPGCRVDMGTADELALDILINALSTFSREQLGLKQLVVGGQNDDWPTPKVGAAARGGYPCCTRATERPDGTGQAGQPPAPPLRAPCPTHFAALTKRSRSQCAPCTWVAFHARVLPACSS